MTGDTRADIQAFSSPVGNLVLTARNGAITRLEWGARTEAKGSPVLNEAAAQLTAYFAGQLKAFDLPLAPDVTPFTLKVLTKMQQIPFGQVRRYGDLAKTLNSAARAVGGACGRNPIPIIIPCHRVLAANGLGGYSGTGGLDIKCALLTLEGYQ